MNAKQCKRLRRYATGMSVGMPQRKLIPSASGNVSLKKNPLRVVTMVNDQRSTRGMYRMIKKQLRRAS
jgi:hypothetical protein